MGDRLRQGAPRPVRGAAPRAVALLALLVVGCAAPPPPEAAPRAPRGAPVPRRATIGEVLAEVRARRPSAALVNVWATYCRPCREEMPELARVRADMAPRGVEVVLVSVDVGTPSRVLARFLDEHGVDFPTYQLTETAPGFLASLHEGWTGAIPATFVYDRDGRLTTWWTGRATHARFVSAIERALEGVDGGDEPG